MTNAVNTTAAEVAVVRELDHVALELGMARSAMRECGCPRCLSFVAEQDARSDEFHHGSKRETHDA